MSYNFEAEMKEAEQKFNIGKGDTFKFSEGDMRRTHVCRVEFSLVSELLISSGDFLLSRKIA